MKPDYKNWMPKGMVYAFLFAFLGCGVAAAAFHLLPEGALNTVLTIESGDGKLARTIIENTAAKSAQVLQMDSMQSTTAQNVADGATYLSIMEKNLDVLKEALK